MSTEAFRFSGNDAANYDEYLGPLIFEPSAKELISRILAFPARSILEISSGTGRVTKHLRETFPATTSLTATDISGDMLELAKKRLNQEAITFQLADAQQLPFPDQSYDLVVNQYGLMFLPDKQNGFNEARRVLKPGGHFVFMTWDNTANMAIFKLIIDDMVIPQFKGEDTSRFKTPFSLHDPALLHNYFDQAGFTDPHVNLLKFKGFTGSAKNILNALFLKHPLGRAVMEKDPASYTRIAHDIEHHLIGQYGTGSFEFELRAWMGIGTVPAMSSPD